MRYYLTNLEKDFGIQGTLATWLHSYLKERRQYTVINDIASDLSGVSTGGPQGRSSGPSCLHFILVIYLMTLPKEQYSCTQMTLPYIVLETLWT